MTFYNYICLAKKKGMYFIMKNKNLVTYILITIIIILLIIIIFLVRNQKTYNNKYIENTSNTTYDTSNEITNSKSNNLTENKNVVQNEIYENNNNISVNDNKIKNVQIKIEENTISPSGVSIIITDNNDDPYTWGENYAVQEKVKDEWKTLNANMNFNSNAYVLDKNNQLKQNINWVNAYGNLPKGTYRIEKEADGDKFYSNEFVIK